MRRCSWRRRLPRIASAAAGCRGPAAQLPSAAGSQFPIDNVLETKSLAPRRRDRKVTFILVFLCASAPLREACTVASDALFSIEVRITRVGLTKTGKLRAARQRIPQTLPFAHLAALPSLVIPRSNAT